MNTVAVLAVVLWVAVCAIDVLVLAWLLRWAFNARVRRTAIARRLEAIIAKNNDRARRFAAIVGKRHP